MNTLTTWFSGVLKDGHLLFGILGCLIVAGIYLWSVARNRRFDLVATVATLLAIVAILFTVTHWNLFALASSKPTPAPLTTTQSRSTAHAVVHTLSLQRVEHPTARQNVTSSPTAQPFPLLVTLEGVASFVGGFLVLGVLLTVASLTLTRRRQPGFIEYSSNGACLQCGQEGDFPVYQDAKGKVAHLCSDCVGRFRVTPVAPHE